MNRPAIFRLVQGQTVWTLGAAVLVAGAAMLPVGCGKPPGSMKSGDTALASRGDPWEVAAKQLRKDTDLTTCRNVVAALNRELTDPASKGKVDRPNGLDDEALKTLSAVVPLNDDDKQEIREGAFSSYDPAYLAECFYLRDAARSLMVPGATPEQLADLGFAWVCRQVYLNPWLIPAGPGQLEATVLSPSYILRRGYGSALERMLVFVALLQQMGLDGCLIGPADAGSKPAGYVLYGPDRRTVISGSPRGPFWAVGVRLGNDIKLYDPWRGMAYPATLSQLKAKPDEYRSWFEDSANVSGANVEEAKKAAVFLATSVNSLAPRMTMLEDKLKAETEVNIAIDPAAVRAAFPDPKPTYWNPPTDRFSPGRAARLFLPHDEGGADRTDAAAGRLYTTYFRDQIPSGDRTIPFELRQSEEARADIGDRFGEMARGAYYAAFLDPPPTPRERLQRGQFRDAARALVERQDEFARALLRVRNTADADKKMREWAEQAVLLYKDLGRVPNARAAIDDHWKAPGAGLLADRAIAEIGLAEVGFLLALCKHEEAERLQARFERATGEDANKARLAAIDAWKGTLDQWRTYQSEYASAQTGLPGRAPHVRSLTARAEKLAQQR